MSSRSGKTMIGSKSTKSTHTTAKGQDHTPDPSVPRCTSKICPVTDPHPAIPFRQTYKGLPKMVHDMESQADGMTEDQVIWLDTFYTIHWDHVKHPMKPRKECVNKDCPVLQWSRHAPVPQGKRVELSQPIVQWIHNEVDFANGKRSMPKATRECVDMACHILADARHEDKQYSRNPKKYRTLPGAIGELMKHPDKARKFKAELERFWKIHGAPQDPLEKPDEVRNYEAGLKGVWKSRGAGQ